MSQSKFGSLVQTIRERFDRKESSLNLVDEGREEWSSSIDFFMSTLGYSGEMLD
jgi:hypothetical protein